MGLIAFRFIPNAKPRKMKKILLLDDNQDILDVAKEILLYEDFEVRDTRLSASFILYAEAYKPDLLIVDYRLADGNGGDICRRLKSHPYLKHVPLIMWSAYTGPDLDLQQYGCDAILSKPFDIEEFLKVIDGLLSRDTKLPVS